MSSALLEGGRLVTGRGITALRLHARSPRHLATSTRLRANIDKNIPNAQQQQQQQQQEPTPTSSPSSSSSHPTPSSGPLGSKIVSDANTTSSASHITPNTRALPSLDFTAVATAAVPAPGADDGANRPTGARSSRESLSTIERRRRFLGRLGLILLGSGLVGAWVYMGREWEHGEDVPQVRTVLGKRLEV